MRNELQIKSELDAILADYRANAHKLTPAEIASTNVIVKGLRRELSDLYSRGAKDCPGCGNPPLGMLRKHIQGFPIYEVGCIVCKPETLEVNGVTLRRSYSAQGPTPAIAAEKWNAGEWLVDEGSPTLAKA